MPIDYKKYPSNWKTEIRPRILARENNCCKFCNIPNGITIIRGSYGSHEDVWQDDDGMIHCGKTSKILGGDYLGTVSDTNPFVTIVLTIAHLDHDISHNEDDNLAALCQRCHLRYDKDHHLRSRESKKLLFQPRLF